MSFIAQSQWIAKMYEPKKVGITWAWEASPQTRSCRASHQGLTF